MDKFVNVNLLRHPGNWIIVYLMVVSFALAIRAVFPATPVETTK